MRFAVRYYRLPWRQMSDRRGESYSYKAVCCAQCLRMWHRSHWAGPGYVRTPPCSMIREQLNLKRDDSRHTPLRAPPRHCAHRHLLFRSRWLVDRKECTAPRATRTRQPVHLHCCPEAPPIPAETTQSYGAGAQDVTEHPPFLLAVLPSCPVLCLRSAP